MNVMLTRLPDGTVNAEPGDAVEYWSGTRYGWECACLHSVFEDRIVIELTSLSDIFDVVADEFSGVLVREAECINQVVRFGVRDLKYVRHARGGAGHLRLQVARLRAFIEKEFGAMERFEELTEGEYKRGVNAMAHINRVAAENALADLERYEYTEPEA